MENIGNQVKTIEKFSKFKVKGIVNFSVENYTFHTPLSEKEGLHGC